MRKLPKKTKSSVSNCIYDCISTSLFAGELFISNQMYDKCKWMIGGYIFHKNENSSSWPDHMTRDDALCDIFFMISPTIRWYAYSSMPPIHVSFYERNRVRIKIYVDSLQFAMNKEFFEDNICPYFEDMVVDSDGYQSQHVDFTCYYTWRQAANLMIKLSKFIEKVLQNKY